MAEGIRFQEVNIELGDKMSEYFYEAAILTRANRPNMLDESTDSFEGEVEIGLRYFAPDYEQNKHWPRT